MYRLEAPSTALDVLLSSRNIDVNVQNADGLTALMVAVLQGKWAIAKRLLATGSCILDICDNTGRSLMDILDVSTRNGLLTRETHAPTEIEERPTVDNLTALLERLKKQQAKWEEEQARMEELHAMRARMEEEYAGREYFPSQHLRHGRLKCDKRIRRLW